MNFHETAQADLDNVFFNENDFAEVVEYNGEEVLAIESDSSEFNTDIPGFVLPAKTILVKQSDVPQPKPGDFVIMEETLYHVGPGSTQNGKGVWSIPLLRKISRVSN